MGMLDRKLLRDLWRLRGQVLAIALVVASGVGVLLMSLTALTSLEETGQTYYERQRFAQVFAGLKRAPDALIQRIAALPGVRTAEARITGFATIDMPGLEEPVVGRLVSLPEAGEPLLNRPVLRQGRSIAAGRVDEVVISEPFALAHDLRPGATLSVVMNGIRRTLDLVGIALSPEFVYAIGPGALMPDDARFGILWLGRDALAAAYDMKGAFNDVSLGLLRGAVPEAVIEQLDLLLGPYGGSGAIARKDQISNWFLMNELAQLKTTATVLPTIFLLVAVFLTNMVLARLIAMEREEIGLLKAFGYSNLRIGWHYAKLAIAISAVGVLLGWIVGTALGRYNTELYADLFRFPFLYYRPGFGVFLLGAAIGIAAAVSGALLAVRNAVALPPAEALRPPTPPTYREMPLVAALIDRLDQPTRIILRQITRTPVRSATTSIGIAFAVAVLIMSLQWIDSIEHLAEAYFHQTLRQDLSVALHDPQAPAARHEFARLPGVLSTQVARHFPADFTVGRRRHRGHITGLAREAALEVIRDARGWTVPVPEGGLVLGTKLAEKLRVGVGDRVEVEILEGRRARISLPIVGLFETYLGTPAFMELYSLGRLVGEGPRFSQVNLLIDQAAETALFRELKARPEVLAVTVKSSALATFHETLAETLLIYITTFTAFACALGFGVTYNSTRIALSERGRELATLRVLGFGRAEVCYILLGEASLLVLLGLLLGGPLGAALSWWMAAAFETELFRIPLVITPSTYAVSMGIVAASAALSGLAVARRLGQLDLIAVLKTRE